MNRSKLYTLKQMSHLWRSASHFPCLKLICFLRFDISDARLTSESMNTVIIKKNCSTKKKLLLIRGCNPGICSNFAGQCESIYDDSLLAA